MDIDIERLLRRVVANVFDDHVKAVHSGNSETAEVNLVSAAASAGENPRRAELRLTHDWMSLTLTNLDVSTVLFGYDAPCLVLSISRFGAVGAWCAGGHAGGRDFSNSSQERHVGLVELTGAGPERSTFRSESVRGHDDWPDCWCMQDGESYFSSWSSSSESRSPSCWLRSWSEPSCDTSDIPPNVWPWLYLGAVGCEHLSLLARMRRRIRASLRVQEGARPASTPSNESNDTGDVAAFLDQARWLFAAHQARSESLNTRATALLGFVGVIFALTLQGVSTDGFTFAWWTWAFLGAALLALLLSAMSCLAVNLTRTVEYPGVAQMRSAWAATLAGSRDTHAVAQFSEHLLYGTDLDATSALDLFRSSADSRAKWFHHAVKTLGLGLFALTALIVDVVIKMG